MKRNLAAIVATVVVLAMLGAVVAIGGGEHAVMKPKGELVWKDMGVPGVSSACVSGDMAKGPCRFYLKYAKGFAAPAHHHSPDHRGAVVSGTLAITAEGKETVLPAGSYFELNHKAVHSVKVIGDEDAVMFIEADGAWDAVMEK